MYERPVVSTNRLHCVECGRVSLVGRAPRWPGERPRAAAAIARESGNPAVDVFVADMSSQTEVRRLAAEVLSAYARLDVLLNNVGGFWPTADGQRTGPCRHRGAGPGED